MCSHSCREAYQDIVLVLKALCVPNYTILPFFLEFEFIKSRTSSGLSMPIISTHLVGSK